MLLPVGVLAPAVLARGGNEQTPAGNNGRMECEENTLSESRVENAVSMGSRKVFRRVILLGFFTSLTIEILQLIAKRGLFEFDDEYSGCDFSLKPDFGFNRSGIKFQSIRQRSIAL
jgi:hypothetical protein